jgi:RNA polymerase sigma-70 factor (ECF subfamily)
VKIDCQYLVSEAIKGNKASFDVLYRNYEPLVYAVLAKYDFSYETREDLVQDVFMKAYINLSSLRDRSKFSSWISQITSNTANSYITLKKNQQKYSLNQILEKIDRDDKPLRNSSFSTGDDSELDYLRKEVRSSIQRMIKNYSQRDQQVLELRLFEGLKIKEIATTLELAEGSIKKYLHFAFKKLRKDLSKIGYTGSSL